MALISLVTLKLTQLSIQINLNMTKKRILITGAAGFIGFHLAKYLHKRGDHVIGLDNFNPYYDPQLKRDRAHVLAKEGVAVISGDLSQKDLLQDLIVKNDTTHFVHLAAQAGVRYSLEDPQAYVTANISGFLNVLEACRTQPKIKLIYASSSSVYGTNTKTPFSVEDRTDSQASFYGVTKKTNELMAFTYHHLYGLPVAGLRFFTVYGPWGRPDMAYFLFTKAILEGRPIDLYNHGRMRRDFTYIDDIIQGTTATLDLNFSHEIFNLGNHRSEEISTLISSLEKALGKKAQLRHLPMQAGDVENTYADIEYSQEKLGYIPKTTLQDGIPKFIDWYKEYTKFNQ